MKKVLQTIALVLIGMSLFAQNEAVYIFGKVVDKEDVPIPNVQIKNRYSKDSMTTDKDGKYKMHLHPKRMQVVEFSYGKAETQVEEFYLREGDKREINITFWDIKDLKHCPGKIYVCGFGRKRPLKKRNPTILKTQNLIPLKPKPSLLSKR